MSQVTINAHRADSTVKLELRVYNESDQLVDADSTPTIDIWDSEGTQQVTTAYAT